MMMPSGFLTMTAQAQRDGKKFHHVAETGLHCTVSVFSLLHKKGRIEKRKVHGWAETVGRELALGKAG